MPFLKVLRLSHPAHPSPSPPHVHLPSEVYPTPTSCLPILTQSQAVPPLLLSYEQTVAIFSTTFLGSIISGFHDYILYWNSICDSQEGFVTHYLVLKSSKCVASCTYFY